MPDAFGRFINAGDIFEALRSDAAEQAVLGALFLDNRLWPAVSELIEANDFSVGLHATIFAAIETILDAGGAANPITVGESLVDDERLAKQGGAKYLLSLAQGVPLPSSAVDYASLIADRARRREIVVACQDALADAAAIEPGRKAERVLEEHETRLFGIGSKERTGGPVPLRDAVDTALRSAEAAYQRGSGLAGISTGFPDLDRVLGGLQAGNLEVLAARPSMGKTELGLDIAESAAARGEAILFLSLEMPSIQLAQRLIAHRSGIPVLRQSRGDIEDTAWERLIEAQDYLAAFPLAIDDAPAQSVQRIRRIVRRDKRRRNTQLVVVDHLQLIREGGRQESRRVEIDTITAGLKALAKELSLPILLLSQLNRALEARNDKRPMLADLRESGSIEQDADRVLFLHRPEYYVARERPDEVDDPDGYARWQARLDRSKGQAFIIIAKNRQGPCSEVQLFWDAAIMQFRSLARNV
jgi:replicative DNA helicase